MMPANSQKLRYRDFFKGKLRLDASLHIGSSDITVETDAALLRDASGRFYIPGTSIAGSLRARAGDRFDEQDLINAVFGWQDRETGQKSKLFVADAIYHDAFFSTVRDGVAIDRRYGAAYPGAKYDLEITPPDLELDLIIRLETRDNDETEMMRHLVFEIMEDFRLGKIRLGGQKSRGLGRCRFEYVWHTLDFNDLNQVRTFLIAKGVENKVDALPRTTYKPASELTRQKGTGEIDVRIEMAVDSGSFLIKDGREGDETDAVFTRVYGKNGESVDYIPGSSVKGVFRSRAEKILRTLGRDICDILDKERGCAAVIKQKIDEKTEACRKKDCEFGDKDAFEIVRQESCPVCRLFGNGQWASRILFSDAFFEKKPKKKTRDNVAIDRFTGGAAEGRLFNAAPVVQGKTSFRILIRKPDNFDKALLLFLLRDLRQGFPPLRFGYGKTRGYGLLNLTSVEINGETYKGDGIDLTSVLNPMPDFHEWWKEGQHHGG